MDLKLKGKRALVLAASGGLGLATAKALVDEGAKVAICSRDRGRIDAAAKQIGAAHAIALDLDQPGAGREVVRQAAQALGGLDVLVINNGGPSKAHFAELSVEKWQAAFQSLWLGVVESIQEALPAMRQARFGRILVITSIAGKEPVDGLTVSNSLRAGLHGLVKTLSDEVAADGVTVNALLPGYTATDRMRQLNVSDATYANEIPARRLGRPEEFAAVAAFLASEPAAYVTGQAIAIDGGWLRGI